MSKSPVLLSAILGLVLFSTVSSAPVAEELECADQPVAARGVGFSPSPEQSAEKAKAEWLKKAQAVYSDAKVETAKDPEMQCVNQGLYSNCKLSAVPCGLAKAESAANQNKQN
jgi:hypothetical protein